MASKKTAATKKTAKKAATKKPVTAKKISQKKVVVKTGRKGPLKTVPPKPLFGDVRTETTLAQFSGAKEMKRHLIDAAQRYASSEHAAEGVQKIAAFAGLLLDGVDATKAQHQVWGGVPADLASAELTVKHADMSTPTDETPEEAGQISVDLQRHAVLTQKATDESPEAAASVASELNTPVDLDPSIEAEFKAKLTTDGFLLIITRRGSTKKIVLDFARFKNGNDEGFSNRVTDQLQTEKDVLAFLGLEGGYGDQQMARSFFTNLVSPLMNAIVYLTTIKVVDDAKAHIAAGTSSDDVNLQEIVELLKLTEAPQAYPNAALRNFLKMTGKSDEEAELIIAMRSAAAAITLKEPAADAVQAPGEMIIGVDFALPAGVLKLIDSIENEAGIPPVHILDTATGELHDASAKDETVADVGTPIDAPTVEVAPEPFVDEVVATPAEAEVFHDPVEPAEGSLDAETDKQG